MNRQRLIPPLASEDTVGFNFAAQDHGQEASLLAHRMTADPQFDRKAFALDESLDDTGLIGAFA